MLVVDSDGLANKVLKEISITWLAQNPHQVVQNSTILFVHVPFQAEMRLIAEHDFSLKLNYQLLQTHSANTRRYIWSIKVIWHNRLYTFIQLVWQMNVINCEISVFEENRNIRVMFQNLFFIKIINLWYHNGRGRSLLPTYQLLHRKVFKIFKVFQNIFFKEYCFVMSSP